MRELNCENLINQLSGKTYSKFTILHTLALKISKSTSVNPTDQGLSNNTKVQKISILPFIQSYLLAAFQQNKECTQIPL
jgi:hypothetical protein